MKDVDNQLLAQEARGLNERLLACEKNLGFMSEQYEKIRAWGINLEKRKKIEGKEMQIVQEKVIMAEENDIKQQNEINRLERERRSNNCRISRIKQVDRKENTKNVIAEFIFYSGILPNATSAQQRNEIEY